MIRIGFLKFPRKLLSLLSYVFLMLGIVYCLHALMNSNSPRIIVIENKVLSEEEALKGHEFLTIEGFKTRFYRNYVPKSPDDHPGSKGAAVKVDEETGIYRKQYMLYGFNEVASSMIPLDRSLPMKLSPECQGRLYPTDLPTASIIIIYHNEANSTLLRTVNTAISRAPYYLIKEVILVDDATDLSKYPHLGAPLAESVKMFPNVVLLRSDIRIGLTRSKLLGAKRAIGDVLVFLDSHCESHDGWLEPLLYHVKMKPRASVTPIIETISYKSFSISEGVSSASEGIFDWKMDFTWRPYKGFSKFAFPTPTMAGGLFAVGRDFFFESGAYDGGMGYWGSENLEISFRHWMCADGVYTEQCSIVGHVFRKDSPHHFPANSVLKNKIRMIEVWTDEYKKYYFVRGNKYDVKLGGDFSDRQKLRQDLKCKSFDWYMKNVVVEMNLPDLNPYAKGFLKNVKKSLCVDSYGKEKDTLKLGTCHYQGGNQFFEYNHAFEIRQKEACVDFMNKKAGEFAELNSCHTQKGNQYWKHTKNSLIKLDSSNICLSSKDGSSVIFDLCNENDADQQWIFQNYNEEM